MGKKQGDAMNKKQDFIITRCIDWKWNKYSSTSLMHANVKLDSVYVCPMQDEEILFSFCQHEFRFSV